MIRRGFLAGLGALVGAGRATAAAQGEALRATIGGRAAGWAVGEAMAAGQQVPTETAVVDPRWARFRSLMEPAYRRRRRQRAVVELLGGMPPHIASCHSWAPWFRAQRAAAWAQQQHDAEDSFEQRLRRAIVGEG